MLPTPNCTDEMEELIVCGEETAAAKRCCADITRRDRWGGSMIAPLSDGTVAVIGTGKRFGEVGVYDPKKRAITRTYSLRCSRRRR